MVIALFMGAGLEADAFFVAFRIPNLLRRLFAEGALSAAFIPTYVETLQNEGRDEAERLARITFTFAAMALGLVTVAGIVFSPYVVLGIAGGFDDSPEKFALCVHLNRIMFPYIFFISLVALASGILNSMGHFAAPAAAPLLLNICMITGATIGGSLSGVEPYYALAWGVVAAGVLQLALQEPFLRASGIRLRPSFNFRHPTLKKIGRLFVPAALAGSVYQINVVIGTMLASFLPSGSVSWLYYADRLVELPVGVFAIALGTAVLPSMSRQAAQGDLPALRDSVSFALRLIAFFTVPASVGLLLLAEPIIGCLFQRGVFTLQDTGQTAFALYLYTAGLWAFSGLKVVTQAFFSIKDTRTPLYVAIGALAVNLACGLLLMGPLRHGGIALATSLAASFNFLVLFALLVPRLQGFPFGEVMDSLARISAASAVMGAVVAVTRQLGQWEAGLTLHNGAVLALCVFGGLALFMTAARILKCSELSFITELAVTLKRRALR